MTVKKYKKKYTVITKIGNLPNGRADCVKYRVNNLLKYVKFLDEKYKNWTWSNIYSNKGSDKGIQLGSFTKNNRPVKATI